MRAQECGSSKVGVPNCGDAGAGISYLYYGFCFFLSTTVLLNRTGTVSALAKIAPKKTIIDEFLSNTSLGNQTTRLCHRCYTRHPG